MSTNDAPRYSYQTTARPRDHARAAEVSTVIHQARLSPEEFMDLFPDAVPANCICHHGSDAEGRNQTYFLADVVQDSNPDYDSHQILFAQALLQIEDSPITDRDFLRPICLPADRISPQAAEYLLITADRSWEPDTSICEDIARQAAAAGVRSSHLLDRRITTIYTEPYIRARQQWANTAQILLTQYGQYPRGRYSGDDSDSYSFIGAGLYAIEAHHPSNVTWVPQPTDEHGHVGYQVHDHLDILSTHYGLSREFLDTLDEMDSEEAGYQLLSQLLKDAPLTVNLV